MFLGRDHEIATLQHLKKKKNASFVVCRGRRRIGKSSLIQEFSKTCDTFLEFQGLAPVEGIGKQEQLNYFSTLLAKQTTLPNVPLQDWSQAFSLLNNAIPIKKKCVVFLDEISWMSTGDKTFSALLKAAWDMELKHHPNVILIICGSITSWIDKNILHNTGFVGRISLTITLNELPLYYCNMFWGKKRTKVSAMERLKVLSITGGVPRYLEEINPSMSAEENIKRLCFQQEGILFNEFSTIFHDSFGRRSSTYHTIVTTLSTGNKSITEIAKAAGIEAGGSLLGYLNDLSESGFTAKEISYNPITGKATKQIKYRIKDNYLRFYLRYIEPKSDAIKKNIHVNSPIDSLIAWHSIIGIQFETLVMNNLSTIIKLLNINTATILSAAPYYQNKTTKHSACQIDLLIHTKRTLYVCEIKFRETINNSVITEVEEKISALPKPKNTSIRPVLIYAGYLDKKVLNEDYFDHIIDIEMLLDCKSTE